jgi:hypothetical protein
VMGYYLADDLTDAVNWILGPGWLTKFYPSYNAVPDIGLLNIATSTVPSLA